MDTIRDGATWEPVPSGLCSNGEFLADMDSSNDLPILVQAACIR